MSSPHRDVSVPGEARHFIGRAKELAALDAALTQARGGAGRIVVLGGEPGIGKTSTAQRVADDAARDGMLVLWGRCPDEPGAPPYWPWRQVLRRCIASWNEVQLHDAAGAAATDLATLEPELTRRLGVSAVPDATMSGAEARFRLFDAVAGFWQRAAARRALLLIFDDLHQADVPSLKLLEYVAAELRGSPIMILGTYRDAEVGRDHPLADALAQASRHVPLQRLKLGGFSAPESIEFIGSIADGLSPQFASMLHERTDGHPLFLAEMARYLLETCGSARLSYDRMALARLPAGAREVIGSRLARLSLRCSRVLSDAAVIGRRFELGLLLPLLDETSEHECVDALDEGRRASLVEPLAEARSYQFTHALIREALLEEMSAPRRAALHRRIAAALEHRHAGDPLPVLTSLAYHYFEARTAGEARKAVDYARRAAEQASATSAYEEAVVHYERALQAVGAQPVTERCELLIALGTAQSQAGDSEAARASFLDAARMAREAKLPQHMAQAALGYEVVSSRGANVAAVAAALVKQALQMNSPLDSAQRVLLFAALSRALVHERLPTAIAMHDTAVAMARRVGDPRALYRALGSITPAEWAPELLPKRLAAGREAMRLGVHAGSDQVIDHMTGWHVGNLTEAGEVDEAIAMISAVDLESERYQPFVAGVHLMCRTMFALHAGRYAEVERLAQQQMQYSSRHNLTEGFNGACVQLFTLRREQGRLGEVAPALELFRRNAPEGSTWLPGYAVLCYELGRHDDARAAFEQLARDDFAGESHALLLRRNPAYLVDLCAWLGDARRAEPLYRLLEPIAGRNLVFGRIVVCHGAADRWLGMLAATMGRWDSAEAHFERALEVDTASRGVPWLAHTRHRYAAMLVERKRPGDAARAAPLLEAALDTCRELGMRALEQRVLELQQHVDAAEPASYPCGLSAREVQVLQMMAEGKTNQEIATALFRSVNTVAAHVRNILAKIDATNRTEAAAFAMRHGLLKKP
jgi:DNA-binding CsgD family transcriptional regulator